MMAHNPSQRPVPRSAHRPDCTKIIVSSNLEDAPIVFRTAYCFMLSVVNMYSMAPVTPNPTSIATEIIEAMSPTSSELIRYQLTVSASKSTEDRAFKPVSTWMRAANSRGDTPGAAFASTNVRKCLSGGSMREAFERVVYIRGRGGYRGRA